MFGDYVTLALKSMVGNKLRTLLSLLGIVIGVASVITIVNLGESASQSVQQEIAATGLETITVVARTRDRNAVREFTPALADRLRDEIDGIRMVVPSSQISTTTRRHRNSFSGTVMGVGEAFAEVHDYAAREGSFFTDADSGQLRQVAVLGAGVAEELFPEGAAIGEYIRILRNNQARAYRVVGVMGEKTASFNLQYDRNIYIPFSTFSKRLVNADAVQRYMVRTEPRVDVLAVSDMVGRFLDRVVGPENYSIFSPSNIAELTSNVTGILSTVLAGIAAISLVVGGIGIMNIMLVSVAERTKEIGIRKAVGASPKKIMLQFLIEAMTLTLVGGLLGISSGIAVSGAAVRLLAWSFYPRTEVYFLAAGFSMTVGVFFGLYPAVKASRLDPIAALNYE